MEEKEEEVLNIRKIYKCVQCGNCCRINPCQYGEITSIDNHECKFLKDNKCGKYEELKDSTALYYDGCCHPYASLCRDHEYNLIIKETEIIKTDLDFNEITVYNKENSNKSLEMQEMKLEEWRKQAEESAFLEKIIERKKRIFEFMKKEAFIGVVKLIND